MAGKLLCKKGNRSTLKLLLNKYKLNINSKAVTGTPLHVAADVGNLEIVKLLVNKGANINFKAGEANTTPLILAARRGFFDIWRDYFSQFFNSQISSSWKKFIHKKRYFLIKETKEATQMGKVKKMGSK